MIVPTLFSLIAFSSAPYLDVLPDFAMMEQEELVAGAERVRILTIAK